MSLKTKLTSLITTFILLCSLLTVGVFAVKNTTFNVGGDIVFNVQGIEATITRGATAGFTADKTIGDAEGNILSNIELNNDMSAQEVADEFAPWSGLNLAFSENVATIKLTIKNTAEEGADNYLDITALADATTKNNAKIDVVNDAGGITALLSPQQSATFTITFSVINDEYSASLNGFSVNFDMQKKVLADFQSYDAVEGLAFVCNTADSTATVYSTGVNPEGDPSENPYNTTGDVVIPSYIQKEGIVYKINSIGQFAFGFPETKGCTLNSITIPYTITSISRAAFAKTSITNSISIPQSVTSLSDSVFYDSKITSIVIPGWIENIAMNMFWSCDNLELVVLQEGITNIGSDAFYQCTNLKNINLPSTLTIIEHDAFLASNLNSILIPEDVETIGELAFACQSLAEVSIDSQVVVNMLTDIYCGGNIILNATTINIRADLTPTDYLTGLGTPTDTVIDGVAYKTYTQSV